MCDNQSGKKKTERQKGKSYRRKKGKKITTIVQECFHIIGKKQFFKQTSPTKTIPKMSRAVVTPA